MQRARDLQVVHQASRPSPTFQGLGGAEHRHREQQGDHDVDRVGQDRRHRGELGQRGRHHRSQQEPQGQGQRGPGGAGARRGLRVERRLGQLLDPAGAHRHHQAERQPRQDAPGEQQGRGLGSQGQQDASGHAQERRREHEGTAPVAVRQRTADEQRGHDAQHVGAEQEVDDLGAHAALQAVHDEQGRELVPAPGDGEEHAAHREPSGEGSSRVSGLRGPPSSRTARHEGGHGYRFLLYVTYGKKEGGTGVCPYGAAVSAGVTRWSRGCRRGVRRWPGRSPRRRPRR